MVVGPRSGNVFRLMRTDMGAKTSPEMLIALQMLAMGINPYQISKQLRMDGMELSESAIRKRKEYKELKEKGKIDS